MPTRLLRRRLHAVPILPATKGGFELKPIEKAVAARQESRDPPTGLSVATRAERLHIAAREYLLQEDRQ